jgi:hypothetical protein
VPYQYKREPLSDDEVNRLTNTCDAFGEKFVIWTLPGTDLMVSSLGGLWQQLFILRNGLYDHTFKVKSSKPRLNRTRAEGRGQMIREALGQLILGVTLSLQA